MNNQVKEMFNTLYLNEAKEHKTNPNSKIYKKRKSIMIFGVKYPASARVYLSNRKKVIKYDDETYFNICNDMDINFPFLWNDLEINFSSKDTRYYKKDDRYVYKVSNSYIYQKCMKENLLISISMNTLERIKNQLDIQEYKNILYTMLVSKLFIIYENFHPSNKRLYEELKDNNFTRKMVLQTIVSDTLNSKDIQEAMKYYSKNMIEIKQFIKEADAILITAGAVEGLKKLL